VADNGRSGACYRLALNEVGGEMKGTPVRARHRRESASIHPSRRSIPPQDEHLGTVRRFLRLCFPSKSALLMALFTCVIVPATLVGLHIHENPELSPIDEGAHLDYVTRIEHGSIPRLGQRLQESTLRVTVCAGFALRVTLPPCDARTLRPQEFPGGGFSYEAQQPPTYYAVTVPFRLFFLDVVGVSDPDATRLVGILWLVTGLLVLWAAARLLRLTPTVTGAAVLLISTAPLVVYESSVTTNDAATILAAALVLFFGALAWRKPGRWTAPTLFVVGAVVTSFKSTDVMPVAAVAGMFAIIAWMDHAPRAGPAKNLIGFVRSWLPNGGALLLGGVASVLSWIVIARKLSLVNPRTFAVFDILRTHPVHLTHIATEALSLLSPATGSYDPFRLHESMRSSDLQYIAATLLAYLLVAGGLSGLFVSPRQWYHWLGLVSVPLLYVGGVILGISIWRTYNSDPGLSGRYGLSLAPFLALALCAAGRGAWLLRAIWLFGLLIFGLTIYFTLVA
jgi:Dolichyl-phosphate-mannose-protein mannosyltransferase